MSSRPAHGLLAGGGEDHARAGPIDHGRAEDLLKLLDAGRQGRLGDMGALGGAAERAVFRQKLQILQLAQSGEHGSHIGLARLVA
jgi:hypothetical protein